MNAVSTETPGRNRPANCSKWASQRGPTQDDRNRREANVAFVYAENAIDSADEVILELLTKTPEAWFHAALTHRGAAWQG